MPVESIMDVDMNMNDMDANDSGDDMNIVEEPLKNTLKNKKPGKKSLYRPTTSQEMASIKAVGLFQNNLFKLQTTELLASLSLTSKGEKTLFELKTILESLEPSTYAGESCVLQVPKDIQYGMSFKAPSKIAVVGSFLLKTNVKSPTGSNVDLVVVMPKELFQEKDFLNGRYFYKRAYYLACLEKALARPGWKLGYESVFHDARRPVLTITSTKEASDDFSKSGVTIRIIPAIDPSTFTLPRLGPSRGNLRKESTVGIPSPIYNSSILLDMGYLTHLNYLNAASVACPNFKEAVILLKVWLYQRGLTQRQFGLNGFVLSMLTAWLIQHKSLTGSRIGKSFSSYQIFKVVLDFIAKLDFKQPLFLTLNGSPLENQPEFSKSAFASNFDVSIVDPTGFINLATHVSQSSMCHFQHEAKMATVLLQDQTGKDVFTPLFLTRLNQLHLTFDNIVRITGIKEPGLRLTQASVPDYPSKTDFLIHSIPNLVQEALGNRIKLVSALSSTTESNSIELNIGLILDPEHAFRVVEHGPDPTNTMASDRFKEIWGEKAELRRFQDGAIRQAVVFDGQESEAVSKMVSFLLTRHFGISVKNIAVWGADQGSALLIPSAKNFVDSFKPVQTAFTTLSKQLKNLKGLPLSISSVVPCSAGLAYSSVFVPQPVPSDAQLLMGYHPYVEPLPVVIQFESSGRWPDDVSAIQVMKQAFYIRIAKDLKEAHPNVKTAIYSGNGMTLLDGGWCDVIDESGFLFRLRIHHPHEITLLDRAHLKFSRENPKNVEELAKIDELRNVYSALFKDGPLHFQKVQNACLSHPALGPSIRLVKRWLSSHLVLGGDQIGSVRPLNQGIPEFLVDLLGLHCFESLGARSPPNSSYLGFLRILDLMASSDLESLEINGFKSLSPKVWQRIQLLASSALQLVQSESTQSEMTSLFMTTMEGYNALLHLNPLYVSKISQNLFHEPLESDKKFKNVVSENDREMSILWQIDTVECLLRDLNSAFGSIAMFFVDRNGGSKIAVVWKDSQISTGTPFAFKTNPSFNVTCIPGPKPTLMANTDAMLAEMVRLSNGFIQSVTTL